MDTLRNWTARRAGARITVHGIDETDETTKIVGIDEIQALDGKIVAIDRNGEEFRLLAFPDAFAEFCAASGTDPDVVMNQFVADLCATDQSGGTDERMHAFHWFERSGFTSWRKQDAA